MVKKNDLQGWVVEVLTAKGGSATLVSVAREIWINYEGALRLSGDLFYTWQYDMRWAATQLREKGVLKAAALSPAGVWELQR